MKNVKVVGIPNKMSVGNVLFYVVADKTRVYINKSIITFTVIENDITKVKEFDLKEGIQVFDAVELPGGNYVVDIIKLGSTGWNTIYSERNLTIYDKIVEALNGETICVRKYERTQDNEVISTEICFGYFVK